MPGRDQPARPFRPGNRCRAAGVAIVLLGLALAVSACSGSSAPSASGNTPVSEPPTSITPSSVTVVSTPPTPQVTTPIPTPSTQQAAVTPTGDNSPTPIPSTCASLAARTYLHVNKVTATGAKGALTLTGNPATIVCGGPDDFHYDVATSTVTAHVAPGASIQVFPVTTMHPQAITAAKFASYLATDQDTKIFMVTGPLTAITALQEQFHP